MRKFVMLAGLAILGLGACSPKAATDSISCATAVQGAIANPPGMTDAQKGIAAGLVASSNPACVGLSADAVAVMANLKVGAPSPSVVPAKP